MAGTQPKRNQARKERDSVMQQRRVTKPVYVGGVQVGGGARQRDNSPAEPLAAADGRELPNPPAESLAAEEDRDFLSGSWAFSSGESRVISQNFQGGDLSVTFGGLELDLRDAALAAGGATLALEVVFASVKIQVPGNWQVIVTSNTHIGGVTENRRQPAPEDAAGPLTITGKLVFGGLEISG